MIEAARHEGALAIVDSAPGENFQKFMAAFGAKYPFLDITTGFFSAPTGRVLARVNAEIDDRHELCIVVQGVAPTAEMAREVCMTGLRQMFYARLPQVKGTAGGVAFAFDEVMQASYDLVRRSGALSREAVCRIFGVPPERITDHVAFDPALAIKFTISRTTPSGSPGDADIFGSQQYGPLLDVEIPAMP